MHADTALLDSAIIIILSYYSEGDHLGAGVYTSKHHLFSKQQLLSTYGEDVTSQNNNMY